MNSLNEDDQSLSDSYGSVTFGTKQILCLVFGCLCIIIGIVDMIVFYVVPNNMAKKNKKNFPDATFTKINKTIIAFHFVLHSFLILFGISLIIYGFIDDFTTLIVMCVIGFLVLVFWIVHLAISYKNTFSPKSQVDSKQMQEIISVKNPIDFIFVYSKDVELVEDCHWDNHQGMQTCTTKSETCYSKNGVEIPVATTVPAIPNFNFSNIPDLLFFTLDYNLDMTSDMKIHYEKIKTNLRRCDGSPTKKVYEYHPERNGTYIVSLKKIPSALKQSSRMASIIFGAGAFYEIYSKSFPAVKVTVTVNADKKPNTNYEDLEKRNFCVDFGSCSKNNHKPKP